MTRPAEFRFWLAVLVASVFVAGLLAGDAFGSPAPPDPERVCYTRYTAPPLIGRDWLGKPIYARPATLEHVRCLFRTGTVPA